MIEIFNKTDIQKVEDKKVKDYLEYSFSRLPEDYKYPEYGYFVVIESFIELITNPIKLSTFSLPSIENGLYDYIQIVEIHDEVVEIVCMYDNDFGVSLILLTKNLEKSHIERLRGYIL